MMTNYKEIITNELKSHRDTLIQSLTDMIVSKFNAYDRVWTIDSSISQAPSQWTFNWTYKNKFFDVVYDSQKTYIKKFFNEDGTPLMVRKFYGSQELEQKTCKVFDYTFTKKSNEKANESAKELATKKVDDMLAFYQDRLHQKLDDTNEAQAITKLEIVSFAVADVFYPVTRIKVEVKNGAKCDLTTNVV
jgi:hypothetical protein